MISRNATYVFVLPGLRAAPTRVTLTSYCRVPFLFSIESHFKGALMEIVYEADNTIFIPHEDYSVSIC